MVTARLPRGRAEDFAACLDPASARPTPADLRGLVDVVSALRRVTEPTPRTEFVLGLRERLLAEASTLPAPHLGRAEPVDPAQPLRARGPRERRLVAAAAAFVLVGGTSGMAAAAQTALPGEALYPLKRGIEQVQTELATSPADEGRSLLTQAEERLSEVDALLEADPTGALPAVSVTLDSFTTQSRTGASLMMASFEETHDPQTLADLHQFAVDSLGALSQLGHRSPGVVHEQLGDSALVLRTIDARVTAACAVCAVDLGDGEGSSVLLDLPEGPGTIVEPDLPGLDASGPLSAGSGLAWPTAVDRASRTPQLSPPALVPAEGAVATTASAAPMLSTPSMIAADPTADRTADGEPPEAGIQVPAAPGDDLPSADPTVAGQEAVATPTPAVPGVGVVTPPQTALPTPPPEATPTQPDEATPTQPDEATPTQPDEATPTQPDEATPTQPDEATPTQPDDAIATELPASGSPLPEPSEPLP